MKKTFPIFLLTLLFLLAACTATQEETAEPTTQPATAVPPTIEAAIDTKPTETAVSTPTPTLCPENKTGTLAQLPSAPHLLRILFLNDDLWLWREETGTTVPLTSGGNVTAYSLAPSNSAIAYVQAGNLWLWRDGQTAVQLTENGRIDNFHFSQDGKLVAFSTAINDDQVELWVVHSDGSSPRLLQTASAADTWARHPDAEKIDFNFNWVADSHILAYQFYPTLLGIGDTPPQPTVWLDGDSGQPLASPPDAALPKSYSGYQLTLATADDGTAEWHLIQQDNGRNDLILPTHPQATWAASPDGRYLIAATLDGAVIINLSDLSQQPIPLTLQTIGVSHYTTVASSWWLGDATWLAVIPESSNVFQPEAAFSLWRVDVAAGTATPLGTYPGFALEVILSPDQSRVAFWEETGNGLRNLHLVDVTSGQDEIYDNGRYSLLFSHWLNDNSQFIYSYQSRDNSLTCFLLGQIGQPPIALTVTYNAAVNWVDPTRAILTTDNSFSDSGSSGTLTFQALNGEPVPIGSFFLPSSSKSAPYFTYFEGLDFGEN